MPHNNKHRCFACEKPAKHTINVKVVVFASCDSHLQDLKTKLGPKAPAPKDIQ